MGATLRVARAAADDREASSVLAHGDRRAARSRYLVVRGYPARTAAAMIRARRSGDDDDGAREQMVRSAMRLDSEGVRTELDRAAERVGVEATLRNVALPAMHEIGDRWKTGACGIEQEHLATDVVRRWCARRSAMAPPPSRPSPVVLACGPNDPIRSG